ncbi:MAG: hypothetical protein DWQ34_06705 [Planctomycetota bacterium]|nr:MAG: hypothetical protein DWQ29_23745 [Planctomycetota bacterium]REJ95212.1 MAG: hypothetical protein DWQ34_06705 [Planctomycetota bacterium]REK25057.1 MAG: hypothetical protein DWQ41_12855 [Planctomycetota bacterium]REK28122.1 MAG: hypothetical protein DWQ45_25180 [Planctomycetota bacterium]
MMQASTAHILLRHAYLGSVAGAACLSMVVLLLVWHEVQTNPFPGMSWHDGLSFFPALHGLWTGAIIGALVAVSFRAVRAPQDVHPLLTIAGSVILSIVAATVLHIIQEFVAASLKSGASGGMFRPFGFVETYLFYVLPGSVILGIVFGFLRAIFRRRHTGTDETA